jgi:fumarate reductase subunit C
MSSTAGPYRRPVSLFWWLERRSYLVFVLRELSSVFVAWFVVYLLVMVSAIGGGNDSYQHFLDWSDQVWVLALNIVSFLFVLLHMVTWFGLAPRAMAVRLRDRRVPPRAILAGHYALCVLLSAVIAWVVLR